MFAHNNKREESMGLLLQGIGIGFSPKHWVLVLKSRYKYNEQGQCP
jgi:hypothetical protein